ncbi:uncharacterized protein TNCT_81881 [Trichonephila clavata]|uniref:Ubiquitin-like protease family profile domain-containing protein n=1 Tax=Trichonephila clavata TaxID=2740835 RepID=A0A8X6K602_TRICU|nr:uncharacterized protein TNCT_81881 [Trichonephila clavata]
MNTGQHWQAMYFDNNQTCIFFCSYGTYPIGKIKKFIDQNSARLEWNSKVLQHPRTTLCGLFCLYFLWHTHRGLPIFKLTETNVCENERIVTRFLHTQFKLANHSTIKSSNQYCQSFQSATIKNKDELFRHSEIHSAMISGNIDKITESLKYFKKKDSLPAVVV